MYMHSQTVILAGGDFNSSINANNVKFQGNHVVWRGVIPWYLQHQISSLWTRSDRSMSSSGASPGKSVLPLAYRLVDTRWRQQGIRTNKHSQPAKPVCSNWDAMGDQYNIPAFSTLTNDTTVVSFHYVITKESPCTVSVGTINPDSVALPFFPLWLGIK